MSLVCMVVGARPNFMKMAPVILETRRRGLGQIVVHTGQHYDREMSAIFFDGLGMPQPNFFLGVGPGSHAEQTSRIMTAFERVCLEQNPTLVVVAGDVNSTLACALVAAKLSIPVAHVEAGLRSFDRSMPEEINRILTDHVASLLFTTEESGTRNLLREGIAPDAIHFVGNPMIDSLRSHLDEALAKKPWEQFQLEPDRFGLVTLHRPANVDNQDSLSEIFSALRDIAREIPLLFPVHPRTRKLTDKFRINVGRVKLVKPLGYVDFLGLMAKSRFVLTDSGGIQEETTALGVPCITVRPNTERPVTIQLGTNRLSGITRSEILSAVKKAVGDPKHKEQVAVPPLWDGQAAHRIVDVMERHLPEFQDMLSRKSGLEPSKLCAV